MRDTIVEVTKKNSKLITEIISVLDNEATPLHQRIALFSLNLVSDEFKTLKITKLEDKRFILEHTYWREYAALLRRNFHHLTQDQQIDIFLVIDRGPALNISEDSDEIRKEQIAKYVRHWKLERYAIAKDLLMEERKESYKTLVAEFGEPEDPEKPEPRFESWTGPTSPLTLEELRKLTTDQIIEYLKAWVPKKDHRSPSPNGIGRLLADIVKERPVEFIERLSQLHDLNMTYARSVMEGLTDALDKIHVDWDKILSFIAWVVNQPTEVGTPEKLSSYDEDPHWGWTKQTIARLIHRRLDAQGEFELPFSRREAVWQVLDKLTWEVNPTDEEDAKFEETGRDSYQHSINTVRGEALHTVVAYALWVGRHIGNQDTYAQFDAMPEVRKNLDAHLDLQKERASTVRSVFGRWLPWLQYLDKQWTSENIDKIFPQDNQRFLDAAWSAFIVWTNPYSDVFDLIKDQYEKAIQRLPLLEERTDSSHSPETRLAEHLMSFYWRDSCGLSTESKIITDFFELADPKLKQHAITWIGRSLKATEEPIPNATLQKMKQLFEWRLKIHQADRKLDHKEIEDFGWWVASNRFPIEWALPVAEQVLDLCKSIDPLFMVIEVAKVEYNNHPDVVLHFISKLVDSVSLTKAFYGWSKEMEIILREAIKKDGPAKTTAKDIAQKLIGMGFKDFKDVLK